MSERPGSSEHSLEKKNAPFEDCGDVAGFWLEGLGGCVGGLVGWLVDFNTVLSCTNLQNF